MTTTTSKQAVFSALKIESSLPAVGVDWEKSEALSAHEPSFLEPDFLREMCALYVGNDDVTKVLLKTAERIRQEPAALRLFWHQHWLIAREYERHWRLCYKFPELAILGEDARPYYLLLAFSGRQFFGDVPRRLGIPDDALRGATTDFAASVAASRHKTGCFGLAPHYAGWWQGLFSGRLFRLGRLTFLHEDYQAPARVFEHPGTHKLCFVLASDVPLTPEGLTDPTGASAWISDVEERAGAITGFPILPTGFVDRTVASVRLNEWREIVKVGDPILGVHISPGSPLEIAACVRSFEEALELHRQYFPKHIFRGFVCDSWLMDPSLAQIASPGSNLAEFQRRFYLVPSKQNLEFVSIRSIFGAEALQVGWDKVPHTTSLQRRAAEFKRRGGCLRNGIGFFPWKKWGEATH